MKTIYIETKYCGRIELNKINPGKLPKKIALVSTVQFVDFLKEIKDYLEKSGKEVMVEKGVQKYPGQILGCEQSSAQKISALVDSFLYVGDGYFHPVGLAIKTGKEIFIFNPISSQFKRLLKKEIEKIKMRRKAQLLKFYSSKEVGVIISTKPGQNNIESARKLVKKYPDKNFYFLLFDNVDYLQLDNFNFLDCFVNSACPRIEEDIKVLNMADIR